MYERVVDGTEGSTAVWTLDGTAASSAITIRLSGADPIEQYAASNLNTVPSMDPTVTEVVAAQRRLQVHCCRDRRVRE
jgi:hypothetical protein